MSDNSGTIEFLFIGWCNEVDKKTGSKHDKVWTAFKAGDNYYAGWGARGKKLSFKNHGPARWNNQMPGTLATVLSNKQRKYNIVDSFQLFSIFPFFEEEVEKQLMFKLLSNKVM